MSYDMSIGEREFNYTYNVADMWYSCYPDKGIRTIYGMTGEESVLVLQYLLEYMQNNYTAMTDLNPVNGWGSCDGAMRFVLNLILGALQNPGGVWRGD